MGVLSPAGSEKLDKAPVIITSKACSFSVQTLNPADLRKRNGLMVTGKIAWLQEQFEHDGVHIIGIQEARKPKDQLGSLENTWP